MFPQVCLLLLVLIKCHGYQSSWSSNYNRYRTPQDVMIDVVNNLALKLLAIHNEGNDNNIAISPYGALSVLVALKEGVQGSAANEIHRATGIPSDLSVIRVGLRDIHRHLKSYFIPDEGFLSGLTLSHDNVTLNREYEDILRFYGFDIDSFNNALYPEFSTSTEASSTTSVVDTSTTSVVDTSTTSVVDTSTTSVVDTSTTELFTTITEVTSTEKLSEKQEATSEKEDITSTVTTTTEMPSTTTENVRTTRSETPSTVSKTLSTVTTTEEPSTTESGRTTRSEMGTPLPTTVVDQETTVTTTPPSNLIESTVTSETSDLTETTRNAVLTTSQESTTLRMTETTILVENLTTEISRTTQENTPSSQFTIISTTSELETSTAETSTASTSVTETTSNTITASVTDTSSTEESNLVLSSESNENTSTTEEFDVTLETDSTSSSAEEIENASDTSTTMMLESTTNSVQLNNDTDEYSDEPKDNNTLRRNTRSVVDYIIARYYDDRVITQRPPPYNSENDLYFLINGKYKETNINYMTYDTVLPFHYISHLNTLALRFPLDSSKYYLLLLLPENPTQINRLICDLRLSSNLKYITDNLRYTHVKAIIPSFMLKGYVVLTSTLQKMGIYRVFEPRHADFSPMTSDRGIYVTNIEQAITVNIRNYVDPATMNNNRYLHRTNPVLFRADHPFLYFVIDSEIDVTLMAGKIVNPLNSRIR